MAESDSQGMALQKGSEGHAEASEGETRAPDCQILTSVEVITPHMAAEYLSRQATNRKAFEHRIQLYARQMQRGEWKLSPQGIAFDEEGRLVDGQHRLRAVLESRVEIPFFVFRRVPRDMQMIFDQGLSRTAGQAAQILGLNFRPRELAIGSSMLMRIPPTNNKEVRTLKEKLDFCLSHQDAIRFAAKISRFAGSKPCENAAIRAIVARAYYTRPKERLIQFMYCLDTGFITDEFDSAAVALRNNWLAGKTSGYKFREELYAKTASALLAFLDGRPLKLVRSLSYQPFSVDGLPD